MSIATEVTFDHSQRRQVARVVHLVVLLGAAQVTSGAGRSALVETPEPPGDYMHLDVAHSQALQHPVRVLVGVLVLLAHLHQRLEGLQVADVVHYLLGHAAREVQEIK